MTSALLDDISSQPKLASQEPNPLTKRGDRSSVVGRVKPAIKSGARTFSRMADAMTLTSVGTTTPRPMRTARTRSREGRG